eukprot:128403_1
MEFVENETQTKETMIIETSPLPYSCPSAVAVGDQSPSFSEGDNSGSKGKPQSTEFTSNVYHFCMLYALKRRPGSMKSIALCALCLFVLAIQFAALYMVTYLFVYWKQPYYTTHGDGNNLGFNMFGQLYESIHGDHMPYQEVTYRNSITAPVKEDLIEYFDLDDITPTMPTFDLFLGIVTLFSLALYSFFHSSVQSLTSALWICLCHDDNDRYPRTSSYYIASISLIFVRAALVFSVFVFIVNALCFAMYFGVAIHWQISLFPIAAIAILHIDEWTLNRIISRYLDTQCDGFWAVRVTEHYEKSMRKSMAMCVFVCIAWLVSWYLSSSHIFFWCDSWYGYLLWAYKGIMLVAAAGAMLVLLPCKQSISAKIFEVLLMGLCWIVAIVAHKQASGYLDQSYVAQVDWTYYGVRSHLSPDAFIDAYADTARREGLFIEGLDNSNSSDIALAFSTIAMVFCGLNVVSVIVKYCVMDVVSKLCMIGHVVAPLCCLISCVCYASEYGLYGIDP